MNASPDIETRLRDYLAAERETIKPPADLEARVLRRLQESDATRPGTGVARPLLLAAALVLFAAGLAFGVARLRAIPGPNSNGDGDANRIADRVTTTGDLDGVCRHGDGRQAGCGTPTWDCRLRIRLARPRT